MIHVYFRFAVLCYKTLEKQLDRVWFKRQGCAHLSREVSTCILTIRFQTTFNTLLLARGVRLQEVEKSSVSV